MRNPNGFGSIVFLGKNRRMPYAVRKTVSWEVIDDKIKQKYKYISYHKDKASAMIALAELNKRRIDVSTIDATFDEAFQEWFPKYCSSKAEGTRKVLQSAYRHLADIKEKKVIDLTFEMLQGCIENCSKGYQTKAQIKQIMQGTMEYAIGKGIRYDNPSAMLDAGKCTVSNAHSVIDNVSELNVDGSIMIMLYSGIPLEYMGQCYAGAYSPRYKAYIRYQNEAVKC